MKYDYPEHYVDNVNDALELAEHLKETGEYDLFRGQCHTYEIRPSALRLDVSAQSVEKNLNEFANWVNRTPDLKSLHGNGNAIMAVAQHYGLKTPFLDFTRSPRIAGFFATDGGKREDTGTIICLNKKRFKESWEDINRNYYKDNNQYLTEIIDIDVNNLWRLQVQEGEFLRCHVDPSLLEMFSCFLHIYFPQRSDTKIFPSEKIYPVEKSHLEVLLDQYFLIASYPDRFERLRAMFEPCYLGTEKMINSEVVKKFITKKLPEIHESWHRNATKQWMMEPNESYPDQEASENVQLMVLDITDMNSLEVSVEEQLVKIKQHCDSKTRPNINWSVVDNDLNELYYTDEGGVTSDENNMFILFSVADMVNSIYTGMRYLPYKTKQIIRAIVRYFVFLIFKPYQVIEDCVGVEFEGGQVRGRGFASRSRIIKALMPDFLQLIDPNQLDSNGEIKFKDTLFAARYIKTSFDFDGFLNLFVEDLIPSQAALAIENLIIGVNPLRIDILGES